MMFGIGKDSSKLLSPILFETLIGGEDSNSYGLSHKGYLYHNGFVRQFCEPARDRQPLVVGVLFDGPRRELSYFMDGVYMGIAFENLALDNEVYYPMISR
jgi:SPRY domain-containing SOCS box protein 3